jgi:hypothetical protein
MTTEVEAPPQFEVGQQVHRYYISEASYGRDGIYCNHEVGKIVEVDGEMMVKTPYGTIMPLRDDWRGSWHDAATDATVKIGKVIIKLHDQIGDILKESKGK